MNKGTIYKIHCNITGEDYYGSTTNLTKRISKHKSKENNCSSKQIIDRGDYEFIILQEVFYNNKTELHMIEADYINNNPCVNILRPYVPVEEQKENIRVYQREYQKQEKFKIYAKNYYHNYYASAEIKYCICGSSYKTESDRRKHEKSKKHQNFINSLNVDINHNNPN